MAHALRVERGQRIKLAEVEARQDGGLDRAEAEQLTNDMIDQLVELQELLYAARQQSVLIILQGLDTSGKDGTIRRVIGPLNSQSCSVASFKVPTSEELSHDFLWRVHQHAPARGDIRIFNRSHYEDVLVVRVHQLVTDHIWRARYEHINAFEQLLADSSTIILKFFLHISKAEQKRRLLERERDPIKAWKLSVGDWQEREHWDDYLAAYEDALNQCSTAQAPWYIVPADRKWFRNLAVVEALRDALLPFRDQWQATLGILGGQQKQALEAYRASRK